MQPITLISGSTLGGAEYVAEHLMEKLQQAGYPCQVYHGPQFAELPQSGLWLVISSTHGAGDLPENLQPCYDAIAAQQPDLSQLRYGAIGIGSAEYDTFCGAIEKVDALLEKQGGQRVGELLRIDILQHDIPEDPAEQWLEKWITLL